MYYKLGGFVTWTCFVGSLVLMCSLAPTRVALLPKRESHSTSASLSISYSINAFHRRTHLHLSERRRCWDAERHLLLHERCLVALDLGQSRKHVLQLCGVLVLELLELRGLDARLRRECFEALVHIEALALVRIAFLRTA